MRFVFSLLFALVVAADAGAAPDEPEVIPAVDVSAYRDQLVVLTDNAGNLVVYRKDDPTETVFYGTKEKLYALQIRGGGSNGDESFNVYAVDFRAKNRQTTLSLRDGKFTAECNDTEVALTPMPAAEAKKVLATAQFLDYRWRRNAVGLYRDEYGVYYYIDRATGDDLDADHRVYIGFRGEILATPLKMVASDSLGRVYTAANGTRRLVITNGEARYVEGDAPRPLYALDLVQDGPFVYGPLGVYGTAPHGTMCDGVIGKK